MQHPPRNLAIDWQETILKTSLPANAKYLALYLRTYMNAKTDMAWPSLSRIVGETGLSKSTVMRYLKILEGEGWLERERGNSTRSTRYYATLPGRVTQTLRRVTQTPQVGSHRPPNKQVNKQTNKQGVRKKSKGRSSRDVPMSEFLTDRSWAE